MYNNNNRRAFKVDDIVYAQSCKNFKFSSSFLLQRKLDRLCNRKLEMNVLRQPHAWSFLPLLNLTLVLNLRQNNGSSNLLLSATNVVFTPVKYYIYYYNYNIIYSMLFL